MLTEHAKTRMQQRGINHSMVETLVEWGEYYHEKGADKYIGTSRCIREMINNGIAKEVALPLKNKYVVFINGSIITIGHLNKKITSK